MGALSGKMLSTECFLMGFSTELVFHNKQVILAGIEKLTEKNVETHRKIPRKSQSCAACVFIIAMSSLAFILGGFCPHQQGEVLCCLGRCCSLGSDLQRYPGKHLCPEAKSHSATLVLVPTDCCKLVQEVLMAPYTQRVMTHTLYLWYPTEGIVSLELPSSLKSLSWVEL